jgi:hypothetical protein
MTRLAKPLKREMDAGGIRRPLVVTLDPDSQRIGITEKGCRTVYWMRLQTFYALAIRANEEK